MFYLSKRAITVQQETLYPTWTMEWLLENFLGSTCAWAKIYKMNPPKPSQTFHYSDPLTPKYVTERNLCNIAPMQHNYTRKCWSSGKRL